MGHTRAESPPQAENFADFGSLNQRFTMGKRSQKGSKKSISGPLLSPPLLSQISQKEGGTEEVICPDGGAPGALTGTEEVENLKKHNFRAISWIWLDFAGSGVISMDIEEFCFNERMM